MGLVCPPERTDFGIRTKVEAFRYQTTAQVLYTCLVRVCPSAPCPQVCATATLALAILISGAVLFYKIDNL